MLNRCVRPVSEIIRPDTSSLLPNAVLFGRLPQRVSASPRRPDDDQDRSLGCRAHFRAETATFHTPLQHHGGRRSLTLAQRRGGAQNRRGTEKADRRPSSCQAPTFDAVQVLSAFKSNLRLFTEHRDALLSVRGVGNRPRGAEEGTTVQAGKTGRRRWAFWGFRLSVLRHRHP